MTTNQKRQAIIRAYGYFKEQEPLPVDVQQELWEAAMPPEEVLKMFESGLTPRDVYMSLEQRIDYTFKGEIE